MATANAVLATYVGTKGLLATSAVSGAVDVDVAVLSALRLVGISTPAAMTANAVLVALAGNALLRLALQLPRERCASGCRCSSPLALPSASLRQSSSLF